LYFLQDEHIKVIISLLEKHGRDPKVLDVLCSLCVGNGVAVRSSQNNICDFLLPGKNLLLQTQLVDHVARQVSEFFHLNIIFENIFTFLCLAQKLQLENEHTPILCKSLCPCLKVPIGVLRDT
jgi:hypothetical protein